MADTHINAYFGDVEEKQKSVDIAKAELAAAKARLEVKKKEVGYVETPSPEPEETPVQEEVKSSNPFKKR